MNHPASHWFGSTRLVEFGGNGFRNEYLVIKCRQQIGMTDQNEVSERGSVRDDNTRHSSQAKPPVRLPILLQILPGIVEPNLMLFEIAIQFVS
jgi:hypothetical protein